MKNIHKNDAIIMSCDQKCFFSQNKKKKFSIKFYKTSRSKLYINVISCYYPTQQASDVASVYSYSRCYNIATITTSVLRLFTLLQHRDYNDVGFATSDFKHYFNVIFFLCERCVGRWSDDDDKN